MRIEVSGKVTWITYLFEVFKLGGYTTIKVEQFGLRLKEKNL